MTEFYHGIANVMSMNLWLLMDLTGIGGDASSKVKTAGGVRF